MRVHDRPVDHHPRPPVTSGTGKRGIIKRTLKKVLLCLSLTLLIAPYPPQLVLAQQTSPSEPGLPPVPEPPPPPEPEPEPDEEPESEPSPLPQPTPPPEPPAFPIETIPDLNQAPPIAIDAIITLLNLGAYPLDENMAAHPNRPLSGADLAFMLINLFAPGLGGEFPVDRQTAFAELDALSGGALTQIGEAPITGELFLPLLYLVLELSPEEEALLRQRLVVTLPAWQLGNFEAPLTRASASILLATTVDFLEARQASR